MFPSLTDPVSPAYFFNPPAQAAPDLLPRLHLHKMAPPRIPLLFAALLLISRTASALQVTPNSPCAAVCQDQPQFDVSAPKSSNTKNGDIFCKDVYHNGPTESKWKTCMTCLQSSTFAQGGENDMMWFLCKPLEPTDNPITDVLTDR